MSSSTAAVAGTLYFTADDGTHWEELRKSDGTEAETVVVKDLHREGSSLREITDVSGTAFSSTASRATGRELWSSSPG